MALNIPLPQVVADTPIGGGAFGAYNALTHAALENRKSELANQYYGPKTNAEITQALAHAGLMGSEQQKNQFQIQNPQYMSPEGFLYGQAFGAGNGAQPSVNQSGNQFSRQPEDMQQGQAVSRGNVLAQGSPAYNAAQVMQGASANEIAGGPGSSVNPLNNAGRANYGDNNPLGASLLQQKLDPLGYANRAQQQSANIEQNNKLIQDASAQANNAVDMQYALDSMDKAYPEIGALQKGAVAGHAPALSDAAQTFDHAAATLNSALIGAKQTGHITDKDIGFFGQLGINRAANKKTFETLSGFTRAIQDRVKEKAPFYSAAAAAGVPPNIYQPLYSMYLNERPVYDYDKRKPIKENQGSWKDYLSPQAIGAMQQGQPYSPHTEASEKQNNKEKSNSSSNIMEAPKGSTVMTAPDGSMHVVHNSQVEKAKKESGFRVGG